MYEDILFVVALVLGGSGLVIFLSAKYPDDTQANVGFVFVVLGVIALIAAAL